jgi:hypothetical protein
MTEELQIPNKETRQRLIANLRKTRLNLQEFGLELEELIAGIEKDIREQRLKRLEKVKTSLRQGVNR